MSKAPPTEAFKSVLASVDRQGRRKWIYAEVIWGFWRRIRFVFSLVLIGFYLTVPFYTINGNPFLRINIPDRQFWIAGQLFWPSDMPYFLLLLFCFLVGTVLLIATCGRVFCGWICPHNVILETMFRPIEALFEGKAGRRRNRDAGKLKNDKKWVRKAAKWTAFVLLSGGMANAMTALFVGKEAFLYGIVLDVVNHPDASIFFAIFFSAILFNFAWFREQTCTIVCPYGRLQSALLDPHSLVVAYDYNRGEPRGKKGKVEGDCVDCNRCVDVCPTGIDIRNGNQLECIHCTACIDACNDVMQRIEKPINLIGYKSEIALEGGQHKWIRGRTIGYGLAFIVVVSVAAVLLFNRQLVDVELLRETNTASVLNEHTDTPMLRQMFKVAITNKTSGSVACTLSLTEAGAVIRTQENPIQVQFGERKEFTMFVDVPISSLTACGD